MKYKKEKNNNMLFSIIIVCKNEEKRISGTLDSICNQSFKDFECIIQDGESKDNTILCVEYYKNEYPLVKINILSEKDEGLYDAMNRAVKRASGEYVCFINAGDKLFDENTLQNIADVIDNERNMDWYYGESIITYPNGDEYMQVPTTIENISGMQMITYLENHQLDLIHQSIFAKKQCLIKFPFDLSYKLRAEVKWYYDCMLNGISIKKMEFPVCIYTYGGISERVSSVPIHVTETKRILEELDLLTEENKKKIPNENDYEICLKGVYGEWLSLKQAGHSMEHYLNNRGIKSVAIYGYAEFGTHVVNELKGSSIQIECIIDKQKKYPYSGTEVLLPEEYDRKVDMIIVTAMTHYKEIYEYMRSKTDCEICSLDRILEEMWFCES